MTTLANIRTKVRRLTACPAEEQLSTADIDKYVNTFYLNDLPQSLKLFSLKEVYTFYASPGVETYALNGDPSFTDSAAARAYYSVEPPAYVSGYQAYYTQSREELYRMFPNVNYEDTQVGTAIAGPYAITISNTPLLRNYITVSATDGAGNRLIAYDDGVGGFTGDITAGAIDYDTGAITALNFTAAIPATETITVQSVPYVSNRPSTILFFNNIFTMRPIPDKTYRVDINAYVYPTVLLLTGDSPEMQFLWQLLAIGAARKVFEDRGDTEGAQGVMGIYSEQLLLCQRKTIEQNRPIRTSTIYASQTEGVGNLNYNNFRG